MNKTFESNLSEQRHKAALGLLDKLQRTEKQRDTLLALLNDILEWDGILPHSKTRIKDVITKIANH